ncbi:hypothetical protein D8674_030113 [Pyrus ussuriensis x Pyrus communis]|uniref:Uncharacterized protein n=1 Tax=Pyrus ussuriensis x Pyrus communis TaxID=2448454 RepID=A0A5N5EVV5_9ROSA|nr:hypothetical protein D8674_030113 [Pyrus ussuriensis x Pyrus communis]
MFVCAMVQDGNSSQPWDLISRYNSSGRLACKMMMRAIIEKQWAMGSDDAGSQNELIQVAKMALERHSSPVLVLSATMYV